MNRIRVRFAPSPTGFLHIGGLRTALYNYLFSKKHNGIFILRIEDTDQSRFVPGAVDKLVESFNWAGLKFDEGPNIGGEYGSYIQSERLEIYRNHANILLHSGAAYRCFCSTERLEKTREEQQKSVSNLKYDRHCLYLNQDEVDERINQKLPFVIRLKIPELPVTNVVDIIRGNIDFQNDLLDDQVLLKSDGFPTYHLANVVDDHLMQISHVIRGEEWLSSLPKHIILYNYFGWAFPKYAHLPLLLNADRSKLSKRQGDVSVEDYRAKGYLKEALLNFILLLGWNAGDDKELYDLDEMIEKFSLERVSKSGAIFNIEKLNWLNAEHLRKKDDSVILEMVKEELENSKFKDKSFSDNFLLKIIASMKERVTFINEFINSCTYFFEKPTEYDQNLIKKRWDKNSGTYLEKLMEEYAKIEEPTKNDYEIVLRKVADDFNISAGKIIHIVRLSLTGVGTGPGLFDLLDILGKDESISRMKDAKYKINY